MSATHYINNLILDYQFKNISFPYSFPYLGLSTTLIDEYGNGYTEPENSEYTRYSGSSIYWLSYEEGKMANSVTIVFPRCITSWGTIVEIFLADSITGGNILYHTKLTPTIPTYTGTQISVNPETIIVSERI